MRGLGLSWGFIARRLGFHPEGRRGAPAPSMHRVARIWVPRLGNLLEGELVAGVSARSRPQGRRARLSSWLWRGRTESRGWDGMGWETEKQRREQYGGRRTLFLTGDGEEGRRLGSSFSYAADAWVPGERRLLNHVERR